MEWDVEIRASDNILANWISISIIHIHFFLRKFFGYTLDYLILI